MLRYRLHTTHRFGHRLVYKHSFDNNLVKTRGKFPSDSNSQSTSSREQQREISVHVSVSEEIDNYLVLIDIVVAI
jgi:hypothetical protein